MIYLKELIFNFFLKFVLICIAFFKNLAIFTNFMQQIMGVMLLIPHLFLLKIFIPPLYLKTFHLNLF